MSVLKELQNKVTCLAKEEEIEIIYDKLKGDMNSILNALNNIDSLDSSNCICRKASFMVTADFIDRVSIEAKTYYYDFSDIFLQVEKIMFEAFKSSLLIMMSSLDKDLEECRKETSAIINLLKKENIIKGEQNGHR